MTPQFFILSPIASYCADDSADISPLPVQMILLSSTTYQYK